MATIPTILHLIRNSTRRLSLSTRFARIWPKFNAMMVRSLMASSLLTLWMNQRLQQFNSQSTPLSKRRKPQPRQQILQQHRLMLHATQLSPPKFQQKPPEPQAFLTPMTRTQAPNQRWLAKTQQHLANLMRLPARQPLHHLRPQPHQAKRLRQQAPQRQQPRLELPLQKHQNPPAALQPLR